MGGQGDRSFGTFQDQYTRSSTIVLAVKRIMREVAKSKQQKKNEASSSRDRGIHVPSLFAFRSL